MQNRNKVNRICAVVAAFIIVSAFYIYFLPDIFAWFADVFGGLKAPSFNNFAAFVGLFLFAVMPFGIGLTFFAMAVGFFFGMIGFLLAYPSCVVGGLITFGVTRSIASCCDFDIFVHLLLYSRARKYRLSLKAIELAVEERPLEFVTLFQLSVFPYGIGNLILATTKVSLLKFSIACFISRLKLLIYVYLGTIASTLHELVHSDSKISLKSVLPIAVGLIAAVILLLFIYYRVDKMLKSYIENSPSSAPLNGSSLS